LIVSEREIANFSESPKPDYAKDVIELTLKQAWKEALIAQVKGESAVNIQHPCRMLLPVEIRRRGDCLCKRKDSMKMISMHFWNFLLDINRRPESIGTKQQCC
jgi:hypothetical protein